mgnify:CR=1 FL=1
MLAFILLLDEPELYFSIMYYLSFPELLPGTKGDTDFLEVYRTWVGKEFQ